MTVVSYVQTGPISGRFVRDIYMRQVGKKVSSILCMFFNTIDYF